MKNNLQLSNLIKKVAQGNKDAFESLYVETSRKIFTAAVCIVKSHAVAKDITQDVFLSLLSNAEKFTHSSNAMGWLLTIARNRSLNWLRKEKGTTSIEDINDWELPSCCDNAENSLMLKEAIKVLNAEEKCYVYLYYVNDLTVREISQLLNKPKSTVHYAITLCQKKLADELSDKK